MKKELPISFFVQMVLLLMVITGAVVTRLHGAALLVLFGLYCLYLFRSALSEKAGSSPAEASGEQTEHGRIHWKDVLFLLLGLAGLILGAKLVVDSAVAVARQFGMSEALIGVTIVALGTSLPELITTIVASVKKQSDIAVGNILGSNIINICLVLGLTVVINPIAVRPGILLDVVAMLAVTAALFLLALPKKRLGKLSGAVLLAMYGGFIAYQVSQALSLGQH